MRPLMSTEHEARLRAEMTRLGEQPGSHVWESDNGRLLTMLSVERARVAFWKADAQRRALTAVASVLEGADFEEEASAKFREARVPAAVARDIRSALEAMGLEP
jgi:hypothetical protein